MWNLRIDSAITGEHMDHSASFSGKFVSKIYIDIHMFLALYPPKKTTSLKQHHLEAATCYLFCWDDSPYPGYGQDTELPLGRPCMLLCNNAVPQAIVSPSQSSSAKSTEGGAWKHVFNHNDQHLAPFIASYGIPYIIYIYIIKCIQIRK